MNETPRAVILNVDDNDGARYAKSRVLRLAGFEVLDAPDGASALEHVRTGMPDLVLLDVKLPDISGLEVCRRIKSDPQTSSVLVLQTSASATAPADKVRALDGGADNFLVAPIEPAELVANVRALLRLRYVEDAYRRVETALKESEERFRQIAENITDVFWIYGFGEQRFLYVNAACELVWGRSAADLCADPANWFSAIHPEDREAAERAFTGLPRIGEYDIEYRISTGGAQAAKRAAWRWVRDRGFIVKNDAGAPYRAAGIASDITIAKAAADFLRESDRRKDEFLATLAHELRNPLAPIRSAIDMLQMVQPAPEKPVAQAHAMIARQVGHLTRLVDDLLDIARITRGKVTLRSEEADLKAAVTVALETIRPLIDERGQTLTVALPDTRPIVHGDFVRLSQVVGNLLHNASKYSPPKAAIALTLVMRGDTVQVSVRDNGIGIAAGLLEKVFDLFVQAGYSPDSAQDGLGIGLSLVKRLVEMHGGRVEAFSAGAGRGSEFLVTLPLLREELDAVAPPRIPAPPGQGRAKRILVVDDNADAADAIAMLLGSGGHEVHTAYEAVSAIEEVKRFAPEVVLLDIGLPGMNGYELARELRGITSNVLMIALTGYGQDRDRKQAKEAGFDHHLTKPVDLANLSALLG
ncbi:MAG: sensor hybrid histidine kinase [Betaproteobacteria bacterium]|nr:sensor hybrid histidine kinase [Betaproteobacteria bacterium]